MKTKSKKKIEILKKRSLVAFSDLKRGINFSSNYSNYNKFDFANLLMDIVEDFYKELVINKEIYFIYHSDNFLEQFSSNINLNNLSKNVNHYLKKNILELDVFSKKTNSLVFYFKFNSWDELNLEIYLNGEEINYQNYLDITKNFNDFIFEKTFNLDEIIENENKDFDPLDISIIKSLDFYKESIDLSYFPNKKIMFGFINFFNLNIFKNKTENHYFESIETYFELSENEVFKTFIKKANKLNIKTIVVFDDGIKSFRIAFKKSKYWEFLNADEQVSIFVNYILEHKNIDNNKITFEFDYEISNYVELILNNHYLESNREIDFDIKKAKKSYFKGNDNYFIISNLSNWKNNLELITSFLNDFEIAKYFVSLSETYGNQEFRIIEKELSIDSWNELKEKIEKTTTIDDIPTKVERVFENEEIAFYLIENRKSKFTLKYYYLDGLIYFDVSFIDDDKAVVLNSLKIIQDNFKKFNEFKSDRVYEIETRSGIFKIFILFLVFSLIALIALFTIFSTDWSIYFDSYSKNVDTVYFWILTTNFILAPMIVALPFYYVYRKFYKAIPFWKLIIIFYIVNFFIGITPLNYLPVIGLIWLLRKQNSSSLEAFSVVALVYLITDGLSLLVNFTCLLHGFSAYSQITSEGLGAIISLSIIGIIWSSFLYVCLFVLFFSSAFYNWVILMLQKISFQFKVTNWYEEKVTNIEWNIAILKQNTKQMMKNFSSVVWIAFFFLIFYVWWELVFYSAIKIVDQQVPFSFADSMGYDTILWEMNIWIPIPGKVGVTEVFGTTILQNVLNWTEESGKAQESIFLYRWFGWYMYIWFSSFFFFGYIIKTNLKPKSV